MISTIGLLIKIENKLIRMFICKFRNRKEQKSKSVAAKPKVTRKTRQTSSSAVAAPRTTRRIQSSTSSDISTSAIVSPATDNNENDEVEQESYKLRSKQPDRIQPNFKELSDSSKQSDEEEEQQQPKQTNDHIPQLDESIRKFLWQPTEFNLRPCTMTEITDSTGSTVLIREIDGNKAKH